MDSAGITLQEVERPRTGVRRRIAAAVAAHEHRTAAALFAVLVFVYLHAVLIGGHVLLPTAGLYYDWPWSTIAPPDLAHYVNRELEDVSAAYYPWDVLARQLLHGGTFPAWNPHAMAGTPFFANFQLAWLSPFTLPLWILPLHWALGLVAAVKLWLAGFGTYLLARELRLGFWPAMLAGVSFALCAFNVVFLSYGVLVSVSAMLPWLLWLAERIVRRGRATDGLALSAVVAVVIASGHPGTELHVLAAMALYALMRALGSQGVARRDRVRRLGLIGAAAVLGTLLTAVALLPAQMAATDTAGALARSQGSGEFLGAHMSYDILRTALFPEWWGRPSEGFETGPALYHERTLYAGVIALVLATVAAVSPSDWKRKLPFATIGLIGAGVAVNAPLMHTVVNGLPLFDRVQNQRLLLWTQLAIAMLGAFGLQVLLEHPRRRRHAAALVLTIGLAVMVPLMSLHLEATERSLAFHYLLDRTGNITTPGLVFASVAWWAICAGTAAVLLLATWWRPRLRPVLLAALVLVAALDLLHFAGGFQPMPPAAKAIPPETAALRYLRRHVGDGRIAAYDNALWADFTTVYGLRDVRGYDQPQPSLRFFRLWRAGQPSQQPGEAFFVREASLEAMRVMSVLGMRYLLFAPNVKPSRESGLKQVYRGADALIYRNRFAVPRAFVPARITHAGSEQAATESIVEAQFDPRTTVAVLNDEQPAEGAPPARGEVHMVSDGNARVRMHASLTRGGLVVLDDAWAPGWRVTVDGRPARAIHPDVVLRGVAVPSGEHEIVWSFDVPGLRTGAVLSALALTAFALWGGWLLRQRSLARRRPTPTAG
jgi:hypothetical protein